MFNQFDIKALKDTNFPVYILGIISDVGRALFYKLKENDIQPAVIWDQDFLKIKYSEDYKSFNDDIKNTWNICVEPIPNNFSLYPKGIIIIAAHDKNQRYWLNFFKKGIEHNHTIYDANLIVYNNKYLSCQNEINEQDKNLLLSCRNCGIAGKSCPVRQDWYNKKGIKKNKVIRHIAIKAGYICNLKCEYCCEFLPQFTKEHIKVIKPENIMEDIQKLSDALEFIGILSFSGGDVMLNKYMADILDFAAKIDNIGNIYNLTNGTYIPHASILDVIENHKDRISIAINGYSINKKAVPLINELNKRGIINSYRGDNKDWFDFSNHDFKGRDTDYLKHLYYECSMDKHYGYYHVYESGKINMRCGPASALLYFLDKWNECKEDFINLRELSVDEIPEALTKLEDRGYLDICNFCPSTTVQERHIRAAEGQASRKKKYSTK